MADMVERKCANKRCGQLFMARAADVRRGWARFCSKSCKAVAQEKRTGQYAAYRHREVERFEDEFDYPDDWCESGGITNERGVSVE
jgi:hypothetical protein